MALTQRLELRQSQSLVMTPQLMQAIKLLQLSSIDLVAYVDAELERNPLLERVDGEGSGGGTAADGPAGDDARPDGPAEAAPEAEIELDVAPADLHPNDDHAPSPDQPPPPPKENWSQPPSRQTVSAEDYNLEAFVASSKTLAEHLFEQLAVTVRDPAMRLVGQALIGEVDEAGYLRADPAELAERLGVSPALIARTLEILKTFEPTGVFAADLAECLALQLKERDRHDPAMAALLANLDLIARRDYPGLRRLCGVDEADLAEMLAELRSLDPKPGSRFDQAPVHPLIPDVLVQPAADGSWRIELNSETLPRLLINQTYHAVVSRSSRGTADRTFIAECFQTANWLIKSLDQRAKTILKVATEIVRQQDGFFANGVKHLRPLNLKAVADAIGMHESTVSRVTSNKYMATTRGIFEMKYFFTSAIAAVAGGEAHSAEAVRHRIRSLIDGEDGTILSDDTIVKLLRQSGVDIARRTVAKYREAMHIPSSVQRRREKLATARA